ncbi:DUF1476 domain-containing protein [Novosphingobium sp. PASSN1]|uniref:DUF1476 domain-containing protein n=1 Tax=Novosphingobium sp. PASSN1 TaxID=2015561 RepID=UPI000BDA6254|nr:DUF1476 domain-containing protein [Novosphingobium sp. PASSN1]OYU34230.1 MAG: aldolase [Novosphingobium sp. PASSN1]
MTTFNDRENAFENQFAHDAELQFKVAARRDKLVGLWAAAKLGLEGDAAADYAKSIVLADLEEAGDEDVVRKLVADLADDGVTEADIRAALAEQAAEARRQIMESL